MRTEDEQIIFDEYPLYAPNQQQQVDKACLRYDEFIAEADTALRAFLDGLEAARELGRGLGAIPETAYPPRSVLNRQKRQLGRPTEIEYRPSSISRLPCPCLPKGDRRWRRNWRC